MIIYSLMKKLNTYIVEKFKINKDTNLYSEDLYIFIPYGTCVSFIKDNFNKNLHFINFINCSYYVFFLTKEEILNACNKKNDISFDAYTLPDEYQNIYNEDKLENKLNKDKINLNDTKHLEIKDGKLI